MAINLIVPVPQQVDSDHTILGVINSYRSGPYITIDMEAYHDAAAYNNDATPLLGSRIKRVWADLPQDVKDAFQAYKLALEYFLVTAGQPLEGGTVVNDDGTPIV